MIYLDHAVGKVADVGFAREILMRQGRVMQLGQWHVSKKRLVRLMLPRHEIDTAFNQLRIDFAPQFEIVHRDIFRRFAATAFHHVRHGHHT